MARHGRSRTCQGYVKQYEGFCETTGEPGLPLGDLFLEKSFSAFSTGSDAAPCAYTFECPGGAGEELPVQLGPAPMLFPPAPIDCLGG